MLSGGNYTDAWRGCLDGIRERTSEEEFARWFQPIVPLGFEQNVLRLRVPDRSYVSQIEEHYIPFLRPIVHRHFGSATRLRYSVPRTEAADKTASSAPAASIKNPFEQPRKQIVIDPQLNPNYNFDTFIEGDCNRLTRSAGLAVAMDPGRTPFNPLFIYGDSGLGKTHVAQAIGMEVKQQHPELKVLYVTTSKFTAQFQNAATKGELNDFIHFYQMIDVLIVDDIQELAGKEKTQNTFFNIFNHLHLSFRQLIITSDKAPADLKEMEQRLLTRFKWGLSTQLLPPDHATKVKIIRSKAARLGAELPDDVVEFMSESITANVREIEGAISSLIANASFLNRAITVPLAREILKAYVRHTRKEISAEKICGVVCAHFNLEPSQLNSPKRTRDIALARQVAMFLCKRYTKMPLSAIGAAIGGKNHATVLHACKTVNNLIDTDREFRSQMEEIESKIKQ